MPTLPNHFSAPLILSGALFVYTNPATLAQSSSAQPIIQQILKLESSSDPKCHATASRLEDFMFGTPLHCDARFKKNQALKQWVWNVWSCAEGLSPSSNKQIDGAAILSALSTVKSPEVKATGDGVLIGLNSGVVSLSARDIRQYSSIAYALRAILAVKQEQLFSSEIILRPLNDEAVQELKQQADYLALAVLKQADKATRQQQHTHVSAEVFEAAWKASGAPSAEHITLEANKASNILPNIIEQKLVSYQQYNQISSSLFARNLQVFLAKRRWPSDPQEGTQLKEFFASAVIHFASDLYQMSQANAQQSDDKLIRESNVHRAVQSFTPFEVDSFEDVHYFPTLDDASVTLEAYDLDAFRDSGLHWLYLRHALNENPQQLKLDADPFAAELLAESIAQFAVLTLRLAGETAIQQQHSTLSVDHIDSALKNIQQKINTPASPVVHESNIIHSAPNGKTVSSEHTYFLDRTTEAGISQPHRSAPWLSRLLRSYLDKGDGTGSLTIPPAFGGAGIAAKDINNDDFPDLLILSGTGNKLYLNQQDGSFKDITQNSGIDWKRADGSYAEPRQPIIADFDNDGDQDIFITYCNDAHRLYENIGNAKFRVVASDFGGEGLVGGPATAFDYDNDGKLDLYIGYFGNYITGTLPSLARDNHNASPNKLFKNLGDLRFEDRSSGSGTEDTGWAQAIGHSDFDGDGRQDLIVGNDFGVNLYYRNLGGGKFQDVSAQLGTNKATYTMGIGITDLNGDQHPDYYISNIVTMNKDQKYSLPNQDAAAAFDPNKLANMRVVEANDLFLSSKHTKDALPRYAHSSLVDRGYSSTGWSWDADFFDFDHDGDQDLYVLNGMNDFNVYSTENPYYTDPNSKQPVDVTFAHGRSEENVFFHNRDGRLQQDTELSGLGIKANARSASYFDYDNDGDLDIAINNYHGRAQVFENRVGSTSGNWVKIKLVGNGGTSNRDAIGATIIVTPSSGQSQWHEQHSTTGYLSVHPSTAHFGIHKSNHARVKVTWPDGSQSQYPRLSANKTHTITQIPSKSK